MKQYWRTLVAHRNLWIGLALLLANGLAWLGAGSASLPPQAEPRLDPQIADIREKLWSGEHKGEAFKIVVTEQMATDAIAWFLVRHPEVPFSHPQVEIEPGGVTGRGLAHVFGLRTPVYGRANILLRDGKPVVVVQEIGVAGVAVPAALTAAIQAELEKQLGASQSLPVDLDRLELGPDTITVEGVYR